MRRYKELKAKQMQAEVAESLEKDRRAERFSLIDPPQLPERPQSPNRPLILIAGMLLSLGGGVGIAAVREGLDRSVKGSRELARLVSVPVLGVIPYVETPAERRRRNATVKFSLLLLAAAGVLTIVFIHYFVIQLPVLWYIATRKFGMG